MPSDLVRDWIEEQKWRIANQVRLFIFDDLCVCVFHISWSLKRNFFYRNIGHDKYDIGKRSEEAHSHYKIQHPLTHYFHFFYFKFGLLWWNIRFIDLANIAVIKEIYFDLFAPNAFCLFYKHHFFSSYQINHNLFRRRQYIECDTKRTFRYWYGVCTNWTQRSDVVFFFILNLYWIECV